MSQGLDSNQNYYSFIDNNTIPLVFIHGVGLDHQMWEASNSTPLKNIQQLLMIY